MLIFVNWLYEENIYENDLVCLIIHGKVATCAHCFIYYLLFTTKVKVSVYGRKNPLVYVTRCCTKYHQKHFSWKLSLDKKMSGSLLREKSSDSLLKANSVHPFISEDKHTGKHKTAAYLSNQMIFSTQK